MSGAAIRARQRSTAEKKRGNTTTVPDPEPPPPPPNASGILPPVDGTVTNGFVLRFVEEFERTVGEGTASINGTKSPFDLLYAVQPGSRGGITIKSYPSNYLDTTRNGRYDPAFLSVPANSSMLRKRIHFEAGWPRSNAIIPQIGPLDRNSQWGPSNVYGGRFEVVWRCALPLDTYKLAWLLWPLSNVRGTDDGFGADGEIDFPECDLGAGDNIKGFMHWQGQKWSVATEQTVRDTGVDAASAAWHHNAMEWIPGTINTTGDLTRSNGGSVKFYHHDVQVGATCLTNIPATPMHWVLQTETQISGGVPNDPLVAGYVDIDWVAYFSYEGAMNYVGPG